MSLFSRMCYPLLPAYRMRWKWIVFTLCCISIIVSQINVTTAEKIPSGSDNLLTVQLGPGEIGSSQSICSGAVPAAFTSTYPAQGGTAPYQYQWQISTTSLNSGYTNITGATGLTYSSPALTQTSYFRRRVHTINDSASFTDPISVTVNPLSVGGNLSGGGLFCPSPGLATLTLSGHTGSIVRWERSSVGNFSSGVTNLNNTTTSQQSPIFSTITAPIYYRALVKSGSCASAYSDVDTVAIYALSVGGSISGSDTVCSGTNSTTLTLSGQTGSVVRWQSATNSGFTGTITNIANTTNTHTALNLTSSTWFRCVIKNGTCDSAFSSTGFVKVDSVSVGGAVGNYTALCAGTNSATIRLTGRRGSVIRWESASNAAFTIGLTTINHTLDSLTLTNLSTTTYYRAIVQNGSCAAVASSSVIVDVVDLPLGGTLSADTTVCPGAHTFNLQLAGHTGSVIHWESSTVSDFTSQLTNISNTTTSLVVSNLTTTTYYRAVLQEVNAIKTCDNYSPVVTVSMHPTAQTGNMSGSDTVCAGTNSTQLTLSGHNGSIVGWQSAAASDFSGNITAITHTGSQLTVTNVSATTYYRAILVLGNCTSYSAVATISIFAAPVGGTVTGNNPFNNNLIVCSGTNSTVLVLSGHTGTIIRWESALTSDFSGNITTIANTGAQYTATNLSQTTYFRAVVVQGDCDTARATPKVVTVVAPTVGGTISGGGSVCSGTNSRQLTLSGHTGNILRWESAAMLNFSGTITSYSNTTTTFTATNLSSKTYYRVWLRNAPCDSTSSNVDSILINAPSMGGNISGNDTVCPGTNTTLLTLTGYVGQIIRWESANNANFTGTLTPINQTSDTIRINNISTTTYYRALVNNGGCSQVFSISKAIHARSLAQGGSLSGGSTTVCINTNSTLLTSNNAVGNIIRWESCPNFDFSGTITPIAHTGSTYLATNISVLTNYRVVVQVADCAPVYSSVTFINVQPQPNGGSVVGGGQVCTGNNAIQLTLVGHQGNIVRWEASPVADFSNNVTSISNSSTSLNVNNLTTSAYYRALVQYLNCTPVASAATQVAVNPLSDGGELISSSTLACAGNNTFVLRLQQQLGSIAKWQSANNANFTGIVTDIAHTADTLLRTNLLQTTYYRVIVKNGSCPNDTSTVLGILIQPISIAGNLSGPTHACSGLNASLLVLTGQTGNILKWQSATNASFTTGLTDIAHTNDSLTVTNLTNTTYYRVIVKNDICSADTSNTIAITVLPLSVAGTLIGGSTVCSSINSSLLILNGQVGSIVKWQSATNASFTTGLTDIAHTNDSLTVANLTNTTYYRVIVKNDICSADTSNTIIITVLPLSVAGTLIGGNTVCGSINSSLLILNGQVGSIVKWQSATNASFTVGLTDISHTNDSLTVNNLTNTTFFRVIVKNDICSADTSNTIVITVLPLSVAGTLIGGNTVCGSINSSLLILNGQVGSIVKWQSATNASFTTGLTEISLTNDSLTVINLTNTTFYRVIVKNDICSADTSNTIIITVLPLSVAGTLIGGNTVCGSINSSLLILSGQVGLIVKWQSATNAIFTTGLTDISHTNDSLSVTNLTNTTYYRVIVKNDICNADTSNTIAITVLPLSIAGTLIGGNTVCGSINSSLLILNGQVGSIVKWQSATNASFTVGLTDISHTNDSLTVTNLTNSTYYRVIVKNDICSADTSNTIAITVLPLSVAGTLIGGNTVCGNVNSSLLILNGQVGSIVKWQSATNAIFTTGLTDISHTNDSLTVNNLTNTTFYRVIVKNDICSADTSNFASVMVQPLSVGGILQGGSTHCGSSNTSVLVLTAYTGSIVKWQSANNSNFTAGLTDITHTNDSLDVINLSTTTYYRVIVQSGVCVSANSSSDSIRILPVIGLNTILPPTPDSFVVIGDPAPITGSSATGGNGTYLYQWYQSTLGPNTGFNLIPGANSANYDPPLLTQTFWFFRTVGSGNCPIDSSQVVQITILPLPPSFLPRLGVALAVDEPIAITDETYRISYRYTLQNYGDGQLLQLGMSQNLSLLFPPPASFSLVQISSNGSISHNASFNGTTQLELLDSNNSQLAMGQSGSVLVDVDVSPNLPLVTYTNQVFAKGKAVGSGIQIGDLSTQGLNPDPDGNGDPSESIPTPVSLRLFIPNGFSPNGDGENDAFVIKGLEKYPNNRIEIFNRWGNKIYEAAPYDNSWTGTAIASGSIVLGDGLLPNGTYFYVLDFGIQGIAAQQGFVVIKK